MDSRPPNDEIDFVERRNTYRRKEDKYLASLIDMHIGMSARKHKEQYRFIERMIKVAERRAVVLRQVMAAVAIWAVIGMLTGFVLIFSSGAQHLVKGWVLSGGAKQWNQPK
ncbi:MAG: hypothetical protein ACREQF_02285 [Candidatus Binataceae bacterium]